MIFGEIQPYGRSNGGATRGGGHTVSVLLVSKSNGAGSSNNVSQIGYVPTIPRYATNKH